ncbi:MAG: hypothetical protein L0H99_08420 [Loigolactobacillus coryniformis]|uniref:Uncharacterized protein n=1 Tax=Loigolactobacillus coryniformis subsp. torquens DSM 20004 = KCTC 3535 TaxID=1423822 RepID=A0A2D1KML9_9LACO|nr:hypothetical protein [Loigolactobacillus coryniformis]ATO43397.1 hypothetical protein LC20004_05510 [Loigolactobacillus coryniformis subsp. torquens DSM 20004 = KCTC 3535]KRK85499.1 hypothetical protein FC16_GL001453 [Loigolactobacillus coryniformis subsp. torquens DSM 20004 = KCTC 3535]MDN5953916.1 hypothetical protein [Loigolactobacillus coryniformis]
MTDTERMLVNEVIYDYLLPDSMDGLLSAESIANSVLDDLQAALDSTVFVEPTETGHLIMKNKDEFKHLVQQAFDA